MNFCFVYLIELFVAVALRVDVNFIHWKFLVENEMFMTNIFR